MRSRSTARRLVASGGERPTGMLSPERARGQVMRVLDPGGIMSSSRFSRRALAFLPAILLLAAATSAANAQTFATVPALSFTTVANGANPLPQVVPISRHAGRLV